MAWLRKIFTTCYDPQPELRSFLDRAETRQSPEAEVTVAIPDTKESRKLLGVPLARRGLQPVFLRIVNRGRTPLRLQMARIDPNYFTPLEAAALNHFSLLKRLSAFGLLALVMLPLVMLLMPLKLITAWRANRRMDVCFQSLALSLKPIAPGATSEGFVYTRLDSGTKSVQVVLLQMGPSLQLAVARGEKLEMLPAVEFAFSIPIPGIAVDYLRHDFETLVPGPKVECPDVPALIGHLAAMPAATTNARGTGTGDPVNLVVIAEFEALISAFVARWDETETISLASCWKTTKAFLLGSEYRYSPVSALFLFNRGQDIALQRIRHSINERLHLRLWLTPLLFEGRPVWIGQVSRDIGVRFTTKTWNLTTHRVDPDVDESRDYVVEDLLEAERIDAAGYVDGVGACTMTHPRRNLTGDPYFTDGKRAAILLSESKTAPRFLSWS